MNPPITLSIIMPCFNRADLLLRTFETLLLQEQGLEYEVIVLDDGGTDSLRAVCEDYGNGRRPLRLRLPLRYLRLDTKPIHKNPALAWNIGIHEARGSRVVIQSPEIAYRDFHNIARLASWPLNGREAVIADVYDSTWANTEFDGWISGGPKGRTLPFLACYRRIDLLAIGGFEEAFMDGIGFDDNEFAERFALSGGRYLFAREQIVAEHLPHPRVADGADGIRINEAIFARVRGQRIANGGRTWGDQAHIVDRWPLA